MTADPDSDDPRTYGLRMTKRRFMALLGGTAAVGSAVAFDDDGETGNLWGGQMALTEAFKVASGERDWYQGPDSAKGDITGQNGDRYSATDTQIEYYWDGSWTALGVGSSSSKAPASHFQSLSTKSVSNTGAPYSYILTTDGSTIDALPQASGYTEYTGETDIGDLITKITRDDLPPTGSLKEAAGRLLLKRGDYPGTLASTVLPAQTVIEGEQASHFKEPASDVHPTVPSTVLNVASGGTGFVPPNADSNAVNFAQVRDIQLIGPGDGTGTAFDYTANSNYTGWYNHFNVSIRAFDDHVLEPQSGIDRTMVYDFCVFENITNSSKFGPNTRVINSEFITSGANTQVSFVNSYVWGCTFRGTGESSDGIARVSDRSSIMACGFRKIGGTNGSGRALVVGQRQPSAAYNWFRNATGGNSWQEAILVPAASAGAQIGPNMDVSGSTHSIRLDGSDETVVLPGYYPNGVNIDEGFQDVTLSVIEGRVVSPETLDLGGTDGTVSPTVLPAEVIPVEVDAGGSVTELEGIGGDTRRDGQTVRLIHTGGENVTVVNNDTAETDPLVLSGGANVTLGTNGDMIEFTYSTAASKWIQTGVHTSQ